MIEIEIQNETHQSQERIRFAAVPRIGEGIRLREPDGCWASYDVLDLWYQKAEYGDVWEPYLHVCMTPSEQAPIAPRKPAAAASRAAQVPARQPFAAGRAEHAPATARYDDDVEPPVYGEEEFEPFTG